MTYTRIVLPEIVIAIGLFLLLRELDIALGVAAIVIGHVVFNSAYATIIIQARFATMTSRWRRPRPTSGPTAGASSAASRCRS